jgi:LGFP repeat
MATVMEKVRIGEVAPEVKIGTGRPPIATTILGLEKAMQARYDSLGSLKAELGQLVNKEGRVWYFHNGCLYYKSSDRVVEIHGDIYKKWVKLGGLKWGKPDTDESPCVDGTGRFNHFENGTKTIFWHPSTGANGVEGDIKVRWNELGWERSYLGYPTSDEVDFPDGGRVNAFQRGGIYWWPDTGAIDINDVLIQYTGLVCIKETGDGWVDPDGGDEPYVVIGVVSPFSSGGYQTPTYRSVDSNTSRPDSMEIYRGKPNGLALAVRLMEHDKGDQKKYTDDIIKAMTKVHQTGTAALNLIPIVGSGIAAIAGPLIQKFIPALGNAVSNLLDTGDDEIGRQTIILTGKDMLILARQRQNSTFKGVEFKFSTNNLRGENANYKIYFGLVPA